MKNVFLDTNILMDIIANREPFYDSSSEVYKLGILRKVKFFTSSNTILTLHYLLKKYLKEENIRKTLDEITQVVSIVPIDLYIIQESIKSNCKDFEDAAQIFAAKSVKEIDFIVTRNLKDFKNSEVTALNPDQFLNEYHKYNDM